MGETGLDIAQEFGKKQAEKNNLQKQVLEKFRDKVRELNQQEEKNKEEAELKSNVNLDEKDKITEKLGKLKARLAKIGATSWLSVSLSFFNMATLAEKPAEVQKPNMFKVDFAYETGIQKNVESFLKSEVGEGIVNYLRYIDQKQVNVRFSHHQKPDIKNFERTRMNGRVEAVLNTFPIGFTDNISQISFVDTVTKMPESYGLKNKDAVIAGYAVRTETGKDCKIVIERPGMDGYDIYWFANGLLPHEITHTLDWSNCGMTLKEREMLLSTIVKRLKSSDRYKSGYVESIGEDGKIGYKDKMYLKAVEYFAEISSAYFSYNDLLPEEDRKIVESVIIKYDSKYDYETNVLNRNQAVFP